MSVIGLRYARALADVAEEQGLDPQQAAGEIADFSATLTGSHDLREILENPSVAPDIKLRVLDAIAGRARLGHTVRNFLAVLIRNDRLSALNEILGEFRAIIDERLHIADAEVTSARQLDEGERRRMEDHIGKLTNSRVRASYKQDASLLGGVTVKIGSTVYDGSVRGQLERLRQQLVQ